MVLMVYDLFQRILTPRCHLLTMLQYSTL